MSLREKFSVIKENLDEEKAAEEAVKNKKELEIQNKELAPVRARIKKLENDRKLMIIISGSLEVGQKRGEGLGMKDYAVRTSQKLESETKHIDNLLAENEEVVNSLGIKNREDLLAKPEFAADEEVLSYKEARSQAEDLKLSDEALKQKLSELGIAIEDKEFSYEKAAAELSERINEIDLEILQEKTKTPEGRLEALEGLTEKIVKSLPEMGIEPGESRDAIKVIINRQNGKNFVLYNKQDYQGRKTYFDPSLIFWLNPKEVKELEKNFEPELVQEALKSAYYIKIEEITEKYKSEYEDDKINVMGKSLVDDTKKARIKQFIDQSLEAKQVYEKLLAEYLKENPAEKYFSIDSVKYLMSHINDNRAAAQSAIANELYKIKKEFPENTKISLHKEFIYFPEILDKVEEVEKKKQEKEEEVKKIRNQISEQRKNEPKIFGKKKWNEELSNLENQKNEIEEEIKKIQHDRYQLVNKSQMNLEKRIDIGGQNDISGTVEEIEEYLKEIVNTEIPKNILNSYNEYNEALEKMHQI